MFRNIVFLFGMASAALVISRLPIVFDVGDLRATVVDGVAFGKVRTQDAPAPPVPSADDPTSDAPTPTSRLAEATVVEAGDASSRRTIRFGPARVPSAELEPNVHFTVSTTVKAGSISSIELPKQRIELRANLHLAADERRPWIRSQRIAKVTFVPNEASRPYEAAARIAANALRGASTQYGMDARGRRLGTELWSFDEPIQGPPRRLIDHTLMDMGRVVFPAEPIGIGATWRVEERLLVLGAPRNVTSMWTLLPNSEVQNGKVEKSDPEESASEGSESSDTLPPRSTPPRSTPPRSTDRRRVRLRLERFAEFTWASTVNRITTTGEFVVDLATVRPVRGRWIERTVMTSDSVADQVVTKSVTVRALEPESEVRESEARER